MYTHTYITYRLLHELGTVFKMLPAIEAGGEAHSVYTVYNMLF